MNDAENGLSEQGSGEGAGRFQYSYTVLLFVLGGLALMMVASHEFFIIRTVANKDEFLVAIMRGVQVIEAIIFLLVVTAAVARTCRSRLALPITAAVSILLALWVPFGTAGFVYWVGWVRKSERTGTGTG